MKYTPSVFLCYTDIMQKDRSFWSEWAGFLQQWGLTEFAAVLLNAAGPLSVLMAQVLYAARPFTSPWLREESLTALADLFEDQDESRSFAAFIRKESTG